MTTLVPASEDGSMTIRIPMTFRKRGGRKVIVTPDGAPWAPRPRVDNALVKALARAFRWRKMLDDGGCGTMEELAKSENVNRGYMSRVLRLTLLAPEFVEAVLDGRLPERLRLEDLLRGFPVEWKGQRSHFRRRPHRQRGFFRIRDVGLIGASKEEDLDRVPRLSSGG